MKLSRSNCDWNPGYSNTGGSWSNEYYWNGSGVRIGGNGHGVENFDLSKQSRWQLDVDYSGYKKGFRLHGEEVSYPITMVTGCKNQHAGLIISAPMPW